jgi:hypothetical protein
MDDESTTDGFDEASAPQGQAETITEETAANGQTETQTDLSTDTETTTEELSDEDLDWAKSKGVNLDDKAAVAKMLRNADRKVSETALKAKTTLQSAVDKTAQVNLDDDVVTELKSQYRVLETKFAAQQYYIDNPDDKQYDGEASAILQELVQTDAELARGLGRNLPALFALAKQRNADSQVAQAEGRAQSTRR